jgi:uncharacterized protein YkwD
MARTARLLPLVFAVAAGALAPTVEATETSAGQLEVGLVRLRNEARVGRGLVPYQLDSRLTALARARSADMASRNYFSHVQPDGRNVFDLIEASGIVWYGAAEIIAWNDWPTPESSLLAARDSWLASAPHAAIVLSADYNYVGVGMATQPWTGKTFWTAIVLKGPDRTPPWARAGRIAVGRWIRSGVRSVVVTWSGADRPLQVLTAGLDRFQVQRRVDGGTWTTIAWPTGPRVTTGLRVGHRYEFRVRARDRAGNYGSWTATLGVWI